MSLTGTGLTLTDGNGTTRMRAIVPVAGQMTMKASPEETILLDAVNGTLTLKYNSHSTIRLTAGTPGQGMVGGPTLVLRSSLQKETVSLDGNGASVTLRNNLSGLNTIFLDGNKADVFIGGGNQHGNLTIRDGSDADIIVFRAGTAEIAIGGGTRHGKVRVQNGNGADTVVLDGEKGDIVLQNADCAEDFNHALIDTPEPGTLMVLDDDGRVRQSSDVYDRRVVGVVSGAGDYRPGVVLDRQAGRRDRVALTLLGKVFCKVDARFGAIEVGDLLTSSATPGHAMKASDAAKAFGSVVGKALRAHRGDSCGLIPILATLQ